MSPFYIPELLEYPSFYFPHFYGNEKKIDLTTQFSHLRAKQLIYFLALHFFFIWKYFFLSKFERFTWFYFDRDKEDVHIEYVYIHIRNSCVLSGLDMSTAGQSGSQVFCKDICRQQQGNCERMKTKPKFMHGWCYIK